MSICAIIAGGGRGLRMATSINKQFLEIDNKPIIAHTLEKFQDCPLIDDIKIVVPEDWLDYVLKNIVEKYKISKVNKIIKGGTTRQESVFNALNALNEDISTVVIHDAVRPLIQPDLLEKVVLKGQETGAAILAVRAQETIKKVTTNIVDKTLNRNSIWLVQTPQVFEKELILQAYKKAKQEKIAATDDSALVERSGYSVHVVEGNYTNIKITNPSDLDLAKFLLSRMKKV